MSTPSKPAAAQKSRRSLMVIFPASSGSLKEKALRLVLSFFVLAGVAAGRGAAGAGAAPGLGEDAPRPAEAMAGIPSREVRKFLRCIWQVLDLNLGKHRNFS